MRTRLALPLAAFLFMLAASAQAAEPRSGEQVYQSTCVACHATKFDRAPQLGDRKAWAPVLAREQVGVTAHAWLGVRNMPPRGGDGSLSLEEFSRAVAYMARAAGGTWQNPDRAMLKRIEEEAGHHDHGKH